jgi:hypothetical protein
VYAALQQVRVGDHQLLAVDAPQPRGLDPHPLDLAGDIAHGDGVADDERLVEHDGERGEKVTEGRSATRSATATPPTPSPANRAR